VNSGKGYRLQWPHSQNKIYLINHTLRGEDHILGYELIWLNNGLDLKKLSELTNNWSPLMEENPDKVIQMTPLERSTLATCISVSHELNMWKKSTPSFTRKWLKGIGNSPLKQIFSYLS
jgi:hypothetical protein